MPTGCADFDKVGENRSANEFYETCTVLVLNEVFMKLKVVVHKAEEGGYWAEVPAIPGCATQGENFEELLKNLYEAVEGCLTVDVTAFKEDAECEILDIAV